MWLSDDEVSLDCIRFFDQCCRRGQTNRAKMRSYSEGGRVRDQTGERERQMRWPIDKELYLFYEVDSPQTVVGRRIIWISVDI